MKVFLSGIAGTGMSALAGLFKQKNWEVAGSDNHFYPPVDLLLENMKVELFQPYAEKNIPTDADLCVIGNVISRGNPEAEFILNRQMEYLSMAEALYRYFIKGKKAIVVAGTHGKTTISSFIAHMLEQAGCQPGFFIGGKPLNFDTNYQVGAGQYFVIEGDEYETSFFDRSSKFLKYHPYYLIVSALEYDHLDFFPSEELYLASFRNLVNQVPQNGLILYNQDFPKTAQIAANALTRSVAYGAAGAEGLAAAITDISPAGQGYHFTVVYNHHSMKFTTSLLGKYNIWNLTAGIMLGLNLGLSYQTIRQSVASFAGVERRLRVIKQIGKTLFLEDFAHHPTALRQMIDSVSEMFPEKKVICFFEPRSWSLRRNFFQDRLTDSFVNAQQVVIKEVYQKEKINSGEALDVDKLVEKLQNQGKIAQKVESYDEMKLLIGQLDFSLPQVVLLASNGDFGRIPDYVKSLG